MNVDALFCTKFFLNSLPLSSCFLGISDDILIEYCDMMSYDLNFFSWESDEDR